jgi:hypothetical protein
MLIFETVPRIVEMILGLARTSAKTPQILRTGRISRLWKTKIALDVENTPALYSR